jgi:hypothetical protein
MAKRVFFAFHYQDVIEFRANVVRKHWVTKPDREEAGFFDSSLWETAKKTSPVAVKRLINGGLDGTSVTCVLIGSQTYARAWVRYEILKSFKRGNRLFGVHINSIPGKDTLTKLPGPNPFSFVGVTYSSSGETVTLHEYTNGAWKEFSEVDDGPSYRVAPVPQQYRGNGYSLSQWFPAYDWAADDGYNNFSSWVG